MCVAANNEIKCKCRHYYYLMVLNVVVSYNLVIPVQNAMHQAVDVYSLLT